MTGRILFITENTLHGNASRFTTWFGGLIIGGVGGVLYGAVMGAFGLNGVQVLYSAAKVPLLLAATTALALPSFFVLNTLLGLRADFGRAVRAVVGTQAAVGVVLAALAPYTALWYLTSGDYHEALLFNGLMFLVASGSAQWVLRRRYRPLIAANRRHRLMLWAWVVVYVFVGTQMGWVLRPFVGSPDHPPTFVRPAAWGNAYVVVFDLVVNEFRRR